ncbi:Isoquinoline 1-oxidoreductase subunit [Litoreibacter roseus]|uniref:Isoquinoline 1-oxidoreductase subunit n=1 Tax=Litoreibacter roseus TaxID=2601869 RepID=A0A6N6JDJ6_9RHOB|nr:Isoquinoline 1-oxidoreductase subunit [Litoreibacter roseus]GFE64204.1 hypothetical protein KIN_12780 [Litoreibacter roseus]
MTFTKFKLATLVVAGSFFATASMVQSDGHSDLQPVSAFDSYAEGDERAAAIFEEMTKVFVHPRCLNCHPVDNSPRQGEQLAMHQPPVVRGEDDFGAVGMRCSTCHGAENVSYSGEAGSVPGHEPWHLAPVSMGWIGKTSGEICEQVKDPDRNGNRTLAELHEHNAEDGLVGWAWEPGEGREPAPGSQALFGELTQAWIDNGAACPTS